LVASPKNFAKNGFGFDIKDSFGSYQQNSQLLALSFIDFDDWD